MTVDEFEQTLLRYKHHEPFQPFVVELLDGKAIPVSRPKLVVMQGAASFLTEDFDLVEFTCDKVRAIRPVISGAA